MGRALILETTFLIDLERERLRSAPGPAHAFLRAHAEERLCLTVTVAGELAAGAGPSERAAWEELIGRMTLLPIDREVSWRYGRLFRYLKENGLLIVTNDLWIAAVAVVNGMPLVTRNGRHFRRVPELQVLEYAGS